MPISPKAMSCSSSAAVTTLPMGLVVSTLAAMGYISAIEPAWMLMKRVKELTEQPSSCTTGVVKLPQAAFAIMLVNDIITQQNTTTQA